MDADRTNVTHHKRATQNGQRWKTTKKSDGTVTLTNALEASFHLNGKETRLFPAHLGNFLSVEMPDFDTAGTVILFTKVKYVVL